MSELFNVAPLVGIGRWHWYDLPILALAAIIIFPDRVLAWVGGYLDRDFGILHCLTLSAIAAGLLHQWIDYLDRSGFAVTWWQTGVFLAGFAMLRLIHGFVDTIVPP